MQTLKPGINVVGASARAACHSAIRAGFTTSACDLFGDVDLRQAANYYPLTTPFPDGLEAAVASMPDAPLIYTGGLENHPDVVDRLAALRPLWGNPGATLRRARDPIALARAAHEAGASPPESRLDHDPPVDLQNWLWKPLAGAGGRGIVTALTHLARAKSSPRPNTPGYFQRRARGPSYSAVYCARGHEALMLGVTRQLIGERWLNARPFAWCGNLGPVELPTASTTVLRRCGEVLATRLGLRGLFGLDFLLDRDVVQPVELNPRYPASAELLDWALEASTLSLHAHAFASIAPPELSRQLKPGSLGKAVLWAPQDLRVTADLSTPLEPWRIPAFADVPAPGTLVRAGHPVITLCGQGHNEAACLEQLAVHKARALAALAPE